MEEETAGDSASVFRDVDALPVSLDGIDLSEEALETSTATSLSIGSGEDNSDEQSSAEDYVPEMQRQGEGGGPASGADAPVRTGPRRMSESSQYIVHVGLPSNDESQEDSSERADEEEEEEVESAGGPLEWAFMILIMTCTVFILFVNDFTQAFLPPEADFTITVLICICFFIFVIEFIVEIIKEGRHYIFSFWCAVDLLAILSLLAEVLHLFHIVKGTIPLIEYSHTPRAGRAARIGARAVRLVRMIKLVKDIRAQMHQRKLANVRVLYDLIESGGIDADGDGELTREELIEALPPGTNVDAIFKKYDTDGNGTLDISEVEQWFADVKNERIGFEKKLEDPEAEQRAEQQRNKRQLIVDSSNAVNHISERTTNKVIIGVLLMLIFFSLADVGLDTTSFADLEITNLEDAFIFDVEHHVDMSVFKHHPYEVGAASHAVRDGYNGRRVEARGSNGTEVIPTAEESTFVLHLNRLKNDIEYPILKVVVESFLIEENEDRLHELRENFDVLKVTSMSSHSEIWFDVEKSAKVTAYLGLAITMFLILAMGLGSWMILRDTYKVVNAVAEQQHIQSYTIAKSESMPALDAAGADEPGHTAGSCT